MNIKREIFYGILISFYLSMVFFIVGEIETTTHPLYTLSITIQKNMNFYLFVLTLIIIIFILIYELLRLNYLYQKIQTLDIIEKVSMQNENFSLKNELKRFKKPSTTQIKHTRFERLKTEGVTYGYVNYEPFFYTCGRNITGIGYEILKEIVKDIEIYDLEKHGKASTWKQLLKGLENKKYDMVASPLYEMRTRLYEHSITFCIPLFYSEIGIYVHIDTFKSKKFKSKKVSFSNFLQNSGFTSPYIADEISELIAKKLNFNIKKNDAEVYSTNELSYIELLEKVNARDSGFNIVAMEVFKAETIIDKENFKDKEGNSTLVNILKDKELIYPVSFVVRKEDTALRNFLNLRIMDLYQRKRSDRNKYAEAIGLRNLFDIIEDELFEYTESDISEIKTFFSHSYDFKRL